MTTNQRTEELLDFMQLADETRKLITDFSHGMQKKLALAAAVIHGPKVLFLDEPFEGVDAIAAGMLKAMLQGMISRGATIFLTTHVLEIVERLCSHVAIISQGRLVANGSLEELRAGVASALPGSEAGQRLTLEEIFLSIVGAAGQEPAQELSWLAVAAAISTCSAGAFSPLARSQYQALASMRWSMFRNTLRTTQGAIEFGARTIAFAFYAVMGLAIAAGFGGGVLLHCGQRRNGMVLAILFWVSVHPLAGCARHPRLLPGALRSRRPAALPRGFGAFFLLHLIFGLVDASTIMGGLVLPGHLDRPHHRPPRPVGLGCSRPAHLRGIQHSAGPRHRGLDRSLAGAAPHTRNRRRPFLPRPCCASNCSIPRIAARSQPHLSAAIQAASLR